MSWREGEEEEDERFGRKMEGERKGKNHKSVFQIIFSNITLQWLV